MKKIISYLITVMMVFTMAPYTAFAAIDNSAAANAEQPISISLKPWVNPDYSDVISEEDLNSDGEPLSFYSSDITYAETPEEGAEVMREYMVNRVESFILYYKFPRAKAEAAGDGTWFDETWDEIIDGTFEHTGVPVEGDYLRKHYGGLASGSIDIEFDGNYENYLMSIPITVTVYTDYDQEEAVTAAVDELLDEIISDGMNDYQKVRAIYDYMTENIVYDYEHLNNNAYKLQFTAYAALINKTSVCQGYANLFYRLALECGIDSRIITGEANGGEHAWNIVKLGSKYYLVDATWDASYAQANYDYEYFLKPEYNDHTTDTKYLTDEFKAAYPMAGNEYSICTEHIVEVIPAVPATCTATGLTEGVKCAECGEVLTQQEEVGMTNHTYDDGVVTTEPTTTTEGVKTYTCTACGNTKTESIPVIEEEIPEDSNTVGDATPETAVISFVGDGLVKEGYFTINGLNNTIEIERTDYTFSWMKSSGTTGTSIVSGDSMKNLLAKVMGITDKAATIKFVSADGREVVFCMDEMFIKDKDGNRPVLAWQIDSEKCNPMLVIGQKDDADANKSKWVKDIIKVEVSEGEPHLYGDWISDTEATCESEGSKHKECSCGATLTEEIPKLPHELTLTRGKEATCVEAGYCGYYTCSVCDKIYLDEEGQLETTIENTIYPIDENNHDWSGELTIDKDATCTEYGEQSYHCNRCDARKYVTEVFPYGHKYGDWTITKEATCTEDGLNEQICSVCGKDSIKKVIKAKGHSFTNYENDTATCVEAGTATAVCDNGCGKTHTVITPALGHTPGTEYIVTAEPTCTMYGLEAIHCETCGISLTYTERKLEALGHDLTKHTAKDPTCTTEGNIEYYTCSKCNKLYADAEGEKEITKPDTIIVNSEAHIFQEVTVAPTCTEPGQTKLVCIGCGKTIVTSTTLPTGHTPDENLIIEPTCEKDGLKVAVKCTVCGEIIKEQEVIPALGHTSGKTVKKATTAKAGSIIETCKTCGEQLSKTTIPRIKATSLSKVKFIYDGKVKKPTVTVKNVNNVKLKSGTDFTVKFKNANGKVVTAPKAVGKYTVTVTFKGNYSGTVSKTFTINPKATAITKLTKPAKKQIKVTWQKRTAQVTGYEIQYSTTKNFTKKTTKTLKVKNFRTNTKTIKQLKAKKKYWVKIRTYKNVNGKPYYSTWSKAKTIITK